MGKTIEETKEFLRGRMDFRAGKEITENPYILAVVGETEKQQDTRMALWAAGWNYGKLSKEADEKGLIVSSGIKVRMFLATPEEAHVLKLLGEAYEKLDEAAKLATDKRVKLLIDRQKTEFLGVGMIQEAICSDKNGGWE